MVEVDLTVAIVIAAWFVSLFIAILVVPRLAGAKARSAWTKWLMSAEADPYLDRVADRVESKMEPRLTAFEDRLSQPVQIDLVPIVAMVTESVIPRVKDEVDKVRAVIDGKIGFMRKVAKGAGEAITETLGEQVAEQAAGGPVEAEVAGYMEDLLTDRDWVKEHPAAAFGLRVLRREQAKGSDSSGGGTGFRRRRR